MDLDDQWGLGLRWSVRGLQGLIVSSGAFFCPPERSFRPLGILGEVVSRCLYLSAKCAHVGVDVGRLANPLHQPTVHSHQPKGLGLLAKCRIVLSL
jgi:hypothetical protein